MKISTILGVVAAAAGVVAIMAASPVRAATALPVSYVFDQNTDSGTYGNYSDSTGMELTDGVLGNEGWETPHQPWVGWTDALINIDFTFAGPVSVNTVRVGSTQDNVRDVVLPSLAIFSSLDGLTWTPAGALVVPLSGGNDRGSTSTAPHGFLTVSGLDIVAPYVRVQLQSHGPFTFVDEVQFANSGVPEPATWAMLLMGFFGLGGALRRRHAAFS